MGPSKKVAWLVIRAYLANVESSPSNEHTRKVRGVAANKIQVMCLSKYAFLSLWLRFRVNRPIHWNRPLFIYLFIYSTKEWPCKRSSLVPQQSNKINCTCSHMQKKSNSTCVSINRTLYILRSILAKKSHTLNLSQKGHMIKSHVRFRFYKQSLL